MARSPSVTRMLDWVAENWDQPEEGIRESRGGLPRCSGEPSSATGSDVDRDAPGMKEVLVSDSLIYRYNPSASSEGQRGSEGTFSLCTCLDAPNSTADPCGRSWAALWFGSGRPGLPAQPTGPARRPGILHHTQ
jgi:hypothetical protein